MSRCVVAHLVARPVQFLQSHFQTLLLISLSNAERPSRAVGRTIRWQPRRMARRAPRASPWPCASVAELRGSLSPSSRSFFDLVAVVGLADAGQGLEHAARRLHEDLSLSLSWRRCRRRHRWRWRGRARSPRRWCRWPGPGGPRGARRRPAGLPSLALVRHRGDLRVALDGGTDLVLVIDGEHVRAAPARRESGDRSHSQLGLCFFSTWMRVPVS